MNPGIGRKQWREEDWNATNMTYMMFASAEVELRKHIYQYVAHLQHLQGEGDDYRERSRAVL